MAKSTNKIYIYEYNFILKHKYIINYGILKYFSTIIVSAYLQNTTKHADFLKTSLI